MCAVENDIIDPCKQKDIKHNVICGRSLLALITPGEHSSHPKTRPSSASSSLPSSLSVSMKKEAQNSRKQRVVLDSENSFDSEEEEEAPAAVREKKEKPSTASRRSSISSIIPVTKSIVKFDFLVLSI